MKSAYLLLLTLVTVVFLGFLVPQARADDANGISIKNMSVQPYAVKVGDTFTVTATLVNNSTVPIVVESGTCSPTYTQIPFFTISLDNHTTTKSKNLTCAGVGLMKILNSGEKLSGTSPYSSTFSYIATKSGTANVTVTFQYGVKNQTDSTQSNIEHMISKSLLFVISDNNTDVKLKYRGGPRTSSILTPLKQFQSGIKAEDVICKEKFERLIKGENGYPTCMTPEHVTRLIQNGWTVSNPFNRIADTDVLSVKSYNLKQVHYYDSSNLNPKASLYDYSYDGIEKDGLVSINNQIFYQTTLDNDIYKLKGISRQFHNVTFSFPEGTLATPGGAFVNLDVKFQDGFEEIYGGTTYNPDGSGSVGGISIPTQYGPHLATTSITVLGNHTMPQAGLTIYKDKIKLLVSYDNHSSLQTIHTVSLGECDVPYESRTGFVPILYMPTGSTGKVCVNYSNGNELTTVTPSVFDAQNLSRNTNDISVSPLQANIVHGNSTVVYTITSGNKVGFYGLTIFCYGTPIAVGYDNQSRIVTGDFPWLNHTYYCMLRSYDYHITGVGGGMGIKYVPP